VEAKIDEVLNVLSSGAASEYFGEPVTQLDHALQAADLARKSGADDETVIAALLHDVGHLLEEDPSRMSEIGAVEHEELGADFLRRRGFSARVATLVQGHVAAKRYLTATNPSYCDRLSEASRRTLALQGGPMSPAEVAAFEASALKQDLLRLRAWDEQAKVPGAPAAPLDTYREMIQAHLAQRV
jgi:phosphonate degradation associated HDIG domain protein